MKPPYSIKREATGRVNRKSRRRHKRDRSSPLRKLETTSNKARHRSWLKYIAPLLVALIVGSATIIAMIWFASSPPTRHEWLNRLTFSDYRVYSNKEYGFYMDLPHWEFVTAVAAPGRQPTDDPYYRITELGSDAPEWQDYRRNIFFVPARGNGETTKIEPRNAPWYIVWSLTRDEQFPLLEVGDQFTKAVTKMENSRIVEDFGPFAGIDTYRANRFRVPFCDLRTIMGS